MVKNKIIEQYWLNNEVNQAFSKMQPEELQYDLKVEVFMVLLEMEDEKQSDIFWLAWECLRRAGGQVSLSFDEFIDSLETVEVLDEEKK